MHRKICIWFYLWNDEKQHGEQEFLFLFFDELEKEGSIKGKVIDIVHDPARTAPIAEVKFENGEKKFILAPESIQVDDEIECGISAPIKFGNTLPLAEIPEGTPIYDIDT